MAQRAEATTVKRKVRRTRRASGCNTFLNITTTPPFIGDGKSRFYRGFSHHINPKVADEAFRRRRGRIALCLVTQQQQQQQQQRPRAGIAGRACSD
jgi:hypothetical protein